MNKYTLMSATLIAIVAITSWTIYFLSYSHRPVFHKQTTHRPDAWMEEVTATIMNKQGKLKMKIVTPRMVHFNDNDTSELLAPHLTLYRKSPQPWFVTANYARATQGIEIVNFWKDVIIHHAADENNPGTIIKTTTLLVHPNKQTAQTRDAVTMIQPNLTVKSKGLFADMNTGDIKLLSEARGEYVPNS